MKKILLPKITFLILVVSLSLGAAAQEEKSEVQVKIVKDGKVLKDTTYIVTDEEATDAAVKMLDITLGEKSGKHGKHVYKFKSDDGKTYEWTSEGSGVQKTENYTYVFTEEGEEGEITIHMNEDGAKTVKKEVIVKKLDGEDEEEKEIIIITGDEPEKIELEGENIQWIDEGGHKVLIISDEGGNEKKVKVISGDKKNSTYNFTTEDGKKIVIKEEEKGKDKEIEIEVTVKDDKTDMKKEKQKKEKK